MKESVGKIVTFLENGQRRRCEGYHELLHLLHTATGMLVMGAILLAVPVVFFAETYVQQKTEENVLIGIDDENAAIDLSDYFGSEDEEAWSPVKDILRREEEQRRNRNIANAVFSGVCGAGCLVYSLILWKKKKKDEEKDENAGTFAAETTSIEKETEEEINMPVETYAPDNGRQENLKRLYEAGILSREEYLAWKKKR